MTDHPDLDALSASLDGEDGGAAVTSHVAGCEPCRARLDGLRRARDAVARPVAPPSDAVRERAIAAALAAFDAPAAPVAAEPAAVAEPPVSEPVPLRSPRRWWLGGSAAAAVLALVIGTAGLLGRDSPGSVDTALSKGAAESDESTAGRAASGGSAVNGGDLGDVADVAALRARVATVTPVAAAGSSGNASSRANSGATSGQSAGGTGSPLAASPEAPPGVAADSSARTTVPSPRQIGTRVCEEQARTARPQVGLVVYSATARFQGTPAVVLGFGATPDGPPSTVLVLAEAGCRLLAETAFP